MKRGLRRAFPVSSGATSGRTDMVMTEQIFQLSSNLRANQPRPVALLL
jgi:hypothetical protein